MASIIKASDRNRGVLAPAFNFDDMSVRADEYLEQVRSRAAQLVAEASQQAEKIRRQAELDGLRAARKQLQTEVEQETARRMQTLIPALQATVAELHNSKQAWLAHWEATGVKLASRIAERILRRELAAYPELPLTLLREALELAVGEDGVRVLLSPQDLQHLGKQVEALVAEFSLLGRVDIVAEEKVAPGGCRLEMRCGVIDQQVAAQLRRIEEELT